MTAVRILAWIHTLLGGAGLLVGTWLCLGLMMDPEGAPALRYIGPLFLFIGVLYLAPAFLGGVGMLRGALWGRWVIIGLSFLLLLAIPVGTLLGGFGLWALLRPKGLPPPAPLSAPVIMRGPPSAEAKRIRELLIAAAGVGSGMVVALTIGFWAHDDPPPPELRGAFYLALPILAAFIVLVLRRRPFAGWGDRVRTLDPIQQGRYRREARRHREAWEAERRARIETLSADPALQPYAARIADGEAWSDDQIAYHRNPQALATCRHMAPIERAMRDGGLDVRLAVPPQVRSPCRIEEKTLWAQFPPGGRLSYVERFLGGRAPEDDPEAFIICSACHATIDVVHPYAVRGEILWFPAGPEASANMTDG